MLRSIQENLARQEKAVLLLRTLLEEEYSRLQAGNAQGVSQIELSIQELMRQIMEERLSLKRKVATYDSEAKRLSDILPAFPEEAANTIRTHLKVIDEMEQNSALQAERNKHLALGLYDQSKSILSFLHKKIMPDSRNTYSRRGRFQRASPQAAIVSGRL